MNELAEKRNKEATYCVLPFPFVIVTIDEKSTELGGRSCADQLGGLWSITELWRDHLHATKSHYLSRGCHVTK